MLKPALWVSYRAHINTGMIMASDGFYEGSLPLNLPTMLRIKAEIKAMVDAQLTQMKPVDKKGAVVIGAPKPQVVMLEVCNIQPAEIDDGVKPN